MLETFPHTTLSQDLEGSFFVFVYYPVQDKVWLSSYMLFYVSVIPPTDISDEIINIQIEVTFEM